MCVCCGSFFRNRQRLSRPPTLYHDDDVICLDDKSGLALDAGCAPAAKAVWPIQGRKKSNDGIGTLAAADESLRRLAGLEGSGHAPQSVPPGKTNQKLPRTNDEQRQHRRPDVEPLSAPDSHLRFDAPATFPRQDRANARTKKRKREREWICSFLFFFFLFFSRFKQDREDPALTLTPTAGLASSLPDLATTQYVAYVARRGNRRTNNEISSPAPCPNGVVWRPRTALPREKAPRSAPRRVRLFAPSPLPSILYLPAELAARRQQSSGGRKEGRRRSGNTKRKHTDRRAPQQWTSNSSCYPPTPGTFRSSARCTWQISSRS